MRELQATGNAKRATQKHPKKIEVDELVQTSFRLPKSRWKKLRELSLDERASVQSIIVSALEAEFARRGLVF